jgi:hypothetical protein
MPDYCGPKRDDKISEFGFGPIETVLSIEKNANKK